MSRFMIGVVAATVALGIGATSIEAQQTAVPAELRAKKLPRQKLSGPRFGMTVFTGDVARLRKRADLAPVMSQFGWQFETQMVSIEGGNQALLEWIILVGGVEAENPTVSGALMAGYRLANGFEFGVGPNLSFTHQTDEITSSAVAAVGATLPFGDIYVPINTALAFARGGPRLTFLTGWIVG
jgi:hypothetical protein